MRAVWWLVRPVVSGILGLLPDAPDPIELVLPWPDWVPFWPFATGLGIVLVVGVATLLLRFARWVYGLIPVI